jgi:hypothetical protein
MDFEQLEESGVEQTVDGKNTLPDRPLSPDTLLVLVPFRRVAS